MNWLIPNLLVLTRIFLATGSQQAPQCITARWVSTSSLVQQKQWLSSRSAYVLAARRDSQLHLNGSLARDYDVLEEDNTTPDLDEISEDDQLNLSLPQSGAETNANEIEYRFIKVPEAKEVHLAEENGSDDSGEIEFSIQFDKDGRPQIQSKNMMTMMLVPLCICIVLYFTLSMIRFMEENVSEASEEQESQSNHGQSEPELPDKTYCAPLTEELVSPARSECSIALPSLSGIKPSAARHECDVVSKIGTPIVRVVVTCMANTDPESAAGGSLGLPGQVVERIELISAKRHNPLGHCEIQVAEQADTPDSGRQLTARIFQHTGELYALLEEVPVPHDDMYVAVAADCVAGGDGLKAGAGGKGCALGGYREFVLSSATGTSWQRRIYGNVDERFISVLDEAENKIINVEPVGNIQNNMDQSVANKYKLRIQPKVDAGVVIAALLAIDRFPRPCRI